MQLYSLLLRAFLDSTNWGWWGEGEGELGLKDLKHDKQTTFLYRWNLLLFIIIIIIIHES
jgi:hypothetical protein